MVPALAPADLVMVLGQSALRSLLLGALVFAVLRLARLRDLRAETHIWTAVLAAALAMPVLTALLPGVALPGVPLPGVALAKIAPASVITAASALPIPKTAARPSIGLILTGVYLLGAAVALLRILAGLVLVAVLYVRAEPVAEPWTRGRAIRASAAIDGPLSFARCILLPADYRSWPETKLAAVLAHEECHVRRGDFFIQLLASVHRALFWFSPFPWWLQRKLGELAETASDAAGARRIGDPARYAEILIDVTRAARRKRNLAPEALAMAHGPGLAKRVDHLLSLAPERAMGAAAKGLALASVAVASLGLADMHAALAQGNLAQGGSVQSRSAPVAGEPGRSLPNFPADAGKAATRARRRAIAARALAAKATTAAAAVQPSAKPAADADQPSYDSLAALRDHDAVAVLPVILTGRGVAQ